jgi:hypothetical protein
MRLNVAIPQRRILDGPAAHLEMHRLEEGDPSLALAAVPPDQAEAKTRPTHRHPIAKAATRAVT